jgi:hypothetical protein
MRGGGYPANADGVCLRRRPLAELGLSLFSLLFAAKQQPASWILPRKLLPSQNRDGGETATPSLFSVA